MKQLTQELVSEISQFDLEERREIIDAMDSIEEKIIIGYDKFYTEHFRITYTSLQEDMIFFRVVRIKP